MNKELAIECIKTQRQFVDDMTRDAFDMAIKALTEQQWILCSERLPEEETEVLVTRTFLGCKDGSHGWNNHIPPSTYVEVAQYFDGEWTALSDEYKIARSRHTDPIAWMPLPEPWEGEKDENTKMANQAEMQRP